MYNTTSALSFTLRGGKDYFNSRTPSRQPNGSQVTPKIDEKLSRSPLQEIVNEATPLRLFKSKVTKRKITVHFDKELIIRDFQYQSSRRPCLQHNIGERSTATVILLRFSWLLHLLFLSAPPSFSVIHVKMNTIVHSFSLSRLHSLRFTSRWIPWHTSHLLPIHYGVNLWYKSIVHFLEPSFQNIFNIFSSSKYSTRFLLGSNAILYTPSTSSSTRKDISKTYTKRNLACNLNLYLTWTSYNYVSCLVCHQVWEACLPSVLRACLPSVLTGLSAQSWKAALSLAEGKNIYTPSRHFHPETVAHGTLKRKQVPRGILHSPTKLDRQADRRGEQKGGFSGTKLPPGIVIVHLPQPKRTSPDDSHEPSPLFAHKPGRLCRAWPKIRSPIHRPRNIYTVPRNHSYCNRTSPISNVHWDMDRRVIPHSSTFRESFETTSTITQLQGSFLNGPAVATKKKDRPIGYPGWVKADTVRYRRQWNVTGTYLGWVKATNSIWKRTLPYTIISLTVTGAYYSTKQASTASPSQKFSSVFPFE